MNSVSHPATELGRWPLVAAWPLRTMVLMKLSRHTTPTILGAPRRSGVEMRSGVEGNEMSASGIATAVSDEVQLEVSSALENS